MYRPESGINRSVACDVLVKEGVIVEPGQECLVKCVADKAFRGLGPVVRKVDKSLSGG
jgi:hypothetical protein